MSDLLPYDFIAGLTEGEGCFALKFRRDVKRKRKGAPTYFNWQALFAIVLRKDDLPLLTMLKDTLGVGTLSSTRDSIRFQIQDADVLLKVIRPFFEEHKLYGKKAKDFALWSEALTLIVKNKRKSINVSKGVRGFVPVIWNDSDLERLRQIRKQMLIFKAKHAAFKY